MDHKDGADELQVPKTHYIVFDPDIGEEYLMICLPIAIFRNSAEGLNLDFQRLRRDGVKAAKLPDLKIDFFSSGPVRDH